MKIIDLLNKIANGEELPKKIKYCGTIYKKFDYNNKYYDIETDNKEKDILSEHLANERFYNDEIEIIDEDKEIESIDVEYYKTNNERYNELLVEIASFQEWCIDKVNSLEKNQ